MSNEMVFIMGGVAFCIWLLTKRWAWLLGLALGIIASVFTALACILHFQILPAIGFCVLAFICVFIMGLLAD